MENLHDPTDPPAQTRDAADGGGRVELAGRVLGELQPPCVTGPRETGREPLWWAGPPWNGEIAEGEFQAVVAAYITRYGAYSPALPRRAPELLAAWIAARR